MKQKPKGVFDQLENDIKWSIIAYVGRLILFLIGFSIFVRLFPPK
jgi:hypothetical protein